MRPQFLAHCVHQTILVVISLFSVLWFVAQIICHIQEGSDKFTRVTANFSGISVEASHIPERLSLHTLLIQLKKKKRESIFSLKTLYF